MRSDSAPPYGVERVALLPVEVEWIVQRPAERLTRTGFYSGDLGGNWGKAEWPLSGCDCGKLLSVHAAEQEARRSASWWEAARPLLEFRRRKWPFVHAVRPGRTNAGL